MCEPKEVAGFNAEAVGTLQLHHNTCPLVGGYWGNPVGFLNVVACSLGTGGKEPDDEGDTGNVPQRQGKSLELIAQLIDVKWKEGILGT